MEPKHTVKASDVIGNRIENWDGENCGAIFEVMLHKNYGEVAYIVMSYPGHFGPAYAEKLFAVPFEALAMKTLPRHQYDYILDVDEDFLRKAPGFNKKEWPDFADARFITQLKDYYKGCTLDYVA